MPEWADNSYGASSVPVRDEGALLLEAVLATVQEPMLVLASDLTARSVNAAFCRTFKVDLQRTIGRKVYELDNGQWNISELRSLLEDSWRSGFGSGLRSPAAGSGRWADGPGTPPWPGKNTRPQDSTPFGSRPHRHW